MNFENEKKQCLEKADKSKKQSVDEGIMGVVELLNSMGNYYTTSSCSGRIVLIEKPESGKKHDAEWLFVSHDKADAGDVLEAMKGKNTWFKQEGAILHVCCRTMEDAEKLLSAVRGEAPPTINYRTADPECNLDYVPNEARKLPGLEFALVNGFGFGGPNGALVLKKLEF